MKRTNSTALFSGLSVIALSAALTGCAATSKLGGYLFKPTTKAEVQVVPAQTNYVPVIVQQPPQIQVVTQTVAGATIYVTNTVSVPPLVYTNTVFVAAHTVTNDVVTGYSVNPQVTGGIQTAQTLNSSLNPTPSAPLINDAFMGLSALLAAAAAWQTKKLNNVSPQADALASVVKAVQMFTGGSAEDLKAQIQTHATLDGTQDDLHALVQNMTGALPATAASATAKT